MFLEKKIKYLLLSDARKIYKFNIADILLIGIFLFIFCFIITANFTQNIYLMYIVSLAVSAIYYYLSIKINKAKQKSIIKQKYNEYLNLCFFNKIEQMNIYSFAEFLLELVKKQKKWDNICFSKELSLYTIEYTAIEYGENILIRFVQIPENEHSNIIKFIKNFEDSDYLRHYSRGYIFTNKIIDKRDIQNNKIQIFDGNDIIRLAAQQNKIPNSEDIKKYILSKLDNSKSKDKYHIDGLKLIYLSFILFILSFVVSYTKYYIFISLAAFITGILMLSIKRSKKT